MNIDSENLLQSILDSFDRIDYIKPSAIPDIDLYMDQVTTFMDSHLAHSRRFPEDKILTKTMINNYAKNHLLPAPDKKKYSKEHILILLFIYYFKGFLSINDIQTLLDPLTNRFFRPEEGLDLEQIYSEVFSLEQDQAALLKKDVVEKYRIASETFSETEGDEQAFLQLFSFICLLSFDVYMKKQLIEKLVDLLPDPNQKAKEKKDKK